MIGVRLLPRIALGIVGTVAVTTTGRASAQIKDEVRVFVQDPQHGQAESVLRVNRKLEVVRITSTQGQGGVMNWSTPMVVDGLGRSWVTFDPLNATKLLRIDNTGSLLPSAVLATNPVNVAISVDGRAYASSRI